MPPPSVTVPKPPAVKEAEIETTFIEKLVSLKYTLRQDIRTRDALEENFREKFNALNAVTLSDSEFSRLLDYITTPDVFRASQMLRTITDFERDDGTPLNFQLVNLKDWCKNTFEVVNQLRINTHSSFHRYDVILLINGLPLVQIELKTLEISPRRAIQQIVDYKHDLGNGYASTLLCFMQLFIVSNRSRTIYFANNKNEHFTFGADEQFLPVYEFADRENHKILRLDRFAETFLPKCTLGETISRYMVLVANEQKMLMMRPYQIYAVQEIVKCIEQNSGNGYIWHTTGSGKTLTSFKASTLLKDNPNIHKCLFVVDRKDLDRQTRDEFNKFQPKCVEENTNTRSLVDKLLSTDKSDKVIVTTIQKLGLALDGTHKRQYHKELAPLAGQRIVFIFDECHRSQFGKNHQAIKSFFPNSQLFGFTGTPIFDQNSTSVKIEDDHASYQTTADIFQTELHKYTITHAIEDRNVLKFHIDYFRPEGETPPASGEPLAKQAVIEAILARHDTVTRDRTFNAVLATSSINDAIAYHALFQKLQTQKAEGNPDSRPLKIACVFSPPAEGNQDVRQLQEDLDQERADNKVDPAGKKSALKAIIADYNANFGTNHRIEDFDDYYKDVQQRIKDQKYPNSSIPADQKIDLTIVVDMLLTGFDSKHLNTLYVDKNLKYHGLIQAFSRTNRVLNDTKPAGKILDFRQQEESVDQAITLFSGESNPAEARQIWLVDPAPITVDKLEAAVHDLAHFMGAQGLECAPEDVLKIQGDEARGQFIQKFKAIQRLKTELDQHTDLSEELTEAIETILPAEEHRAFKGTYLDVAHQLKKKQDKPDSETTPEIENLDFEFVLFSSAVIDYDYIMQLLAEFTQYAPGKQEMTRDQLIQLIAADAKFADQVHDITAYIHTLKPGEGLDKEAIISGYEDFRTQRETEELTKMAQAHGLTKKALHDFVDDVLFRHTFDGELLTDLLAPLDLGWKERRLRELALMEDLLPLLKQRAKGQHLFGLEGYES